MNDIVIYISLCLVLPISLLCFYLEKRARRIMLSVILGVLTCLVAYAINNSFIKTLCLNKEQYGMFVAPVAEEILKFICVFAFGIVVKKGKRGSAANAFSVGVGFCVTENFCYLISNIETANVFWIISRSIGTGLMHCITSSLYGVAVFKAKWKDKRKGLLVFGVILCGIAFHEVYNIFVQISTLHVVGVLMPIIAFFVLFYFIKGHELHNYLWDKE